jgi:hypothetical protein
VRVSRHFPGIVRSLQLLGAWRLSELSPLTPNVDQFEVQFKHSPRVNLAGTHLPTFYGAIRDPDQRCRQSGLVVGKPQNC